METINLQVRNTRITCVLLKGTMWITVAMTLTDQGAPRRDRAPGRWPDWVPESAQNYITHTEKGLSIRALARHKGCHPSTILRQIRRIEARREDPLVDEALKRFGEDGQPTNATPDAPDDMTSQSHAALTALNPRGRLLAVADGMDKSIVVDTNDRGAVSRGVVGRDVVLILALRGWITCTTRGRICRYAISPAGRAALGELTARQENAAAVGFSEAHSPFAHDSMNAEEDRVTRYSPAESPVAMLARRRDRSGAPFLSADLVDAAERLRQDFTLSQMAGDTRAGDRVAAALDTLGPGLADVAQRCCCEMEGLETAEREMGWSARSGKIVLRIALQRLRRHYLEAARDSALIG